MYLQIAQNQVRLMQQEVYRALKSNCREMND